jgi:hypothetical protein
MTRGAMKAALAQLFDETPGTDAGDAPFFWDQILIWATDRIAGATDCCWGIRYTATVEDQLEYCPPEDLHKVFFLSVLDGNSQYQELAIVSRLRANSHLGSRWQNEASVDPPTHGVLQMGGSAYLYPPSSAARDAGLRWEGFATPGEVWAYDAVTFAAQAITDSTEHPFFAWAQQAVIWEAALIRIIQFPTAQNLARQPMIARELRKEKGKVEHRAAKWFRENVAPRVAQRWLT